MEFLHYLEPKTLVAMFGPAALVIIAFIVFAESGLFFGFFLPGDSLLFAAGVLAAQGAFSLPVLISFWWWLPSLATEWGTGWQSFRSPPLSERGQHLVPP